jgi:hypothetical protein
VTDARPAIPELSFAAVVASLHRQQVRFTLVGAWGANFHTLDASTLFATPDYDLFLPLDPENLLRAWQVAEASGLVLQTDGGLLDAPRDRDADLARAVVDRHAVTRATASVLAINLRLIMAAFAFEPVWEERRTFLLDGVEIPVARLSHIIRSKAATNREKDRCFLATHAEVLRQMLDGDEDS